MEAKMAIIAITTSSSIRVKNLFALTKGGAKQEKIRSEKERQR